MMCALQLPTMLITAWMYFIFTLFLLAQHIYYTRYKPTAPETGQVSSLCYVVSYCGSSWLL